MERRCCDAISHGYPGGATLYIVRKRLFRFFSKRISTINSSRFVDAVDVGSNRNHRLLVHCDAAFERALFGGVTRGVVLHSTLFLDDIVACILGHSSLQSRRDSSARSHGLGHCERGE